MANGSRRRVRSRAAVLVGLLVCAGCGTAAPGGGEAPAPVGGADADGAIMLLDTVTRVPIAAHEVAVLSYLDAPQALHGCTLIARISVVAGSLEQMRRAAVPHAARLGATAMVLAERQTMRTENSASRAGLGAATIRTRYTLDAVDCR